MNKKILFAMICFFTAVIIGFLIWGFWPKGSQEIVCTQEAKLCLDGSSVGRTSPNCEFAECPNGSLGENQESYVNEELGIRFDLLEEFTNAFGKPISSEKFNGTNGKGISIIFGTNGKIVSGLETELSLTAYTQDYDDTYANMFGYIDTWKGESDVAQACNQQLDYKKDVICKVIDLAGTKAIFQTSLSNYEASCLFFINIYFNNLSNSIYKGINLNLYFRDIEEKVCNYSNEWPENYSEEQWWKSARVEFENQSRNIMEMKNLSVKDKEALEALNRMLSTLKFINQ